MHLIGIFSILSNLQVTTHLFNSIPSILLGFSNRQFCQLWARSVTSHICKILLQIQNILFQNFNNESFITSNLLAITKYYKRQQLIISLPNNIRFFLSAEHQMGQAMSCCGENIFKELFEAYGQKFTKLMVAQKVKILIGDEFSSLLGKFSGVFKGFQAKTSGVIEDGRQQINKLYGQVKSKINDSVPGGINALEKIKGQSIDQFSGYNKLQSKVDQVKQTTISKIDNEKAELQAQMRAKKIEMVNKVEEERPKIDIYEQLPENMRIYLLKQAETKFSSEISQNKQQIVKQIGKQFNVEGVEKLYSKFDPKSPVDSIVGQALGILVGSVGAGGFGSKINNIIQGGLNFFGN